MPKEAVPYLKNEAVSHLKWGYDGLPVSQYEVPPEEALLSLLLRVGHPRQVLLYVLLRKGPEFKSRPDVV